MTQTEREHIDEVLTQAARMHGKGETSEELRSDLETLLRLCKRDAESSDVARVYHAIATHCMIRAQLNNAIQHCTTGLAIVGDSHTQLEVDLLVLLARLSLANDVAKAQEISLKAMNLSKQINGRALPSVMLPHAESIGANGDMEGSIALLRQAEALYELDGDERGRMLVLLRLCVQLVNLRQFTLVIEYATDVIALADELDRHMAKVNGFKFLAMALNGIGKPAEAYEVGKRALDLAEAHHPGHLVGDCSGVLGDVYLTLNDLPTALTWFARALSVYRVTGHRNGQALCLMRMGEIYTSSGQLDLAERLLTEAESVSDAIGNNVLKQSVAEVRAGLNIRRQDSSNTSSTDSVDRAVNVFRKIAGSTRPQPLPVYDEIGAHRFKVTTLGSFCVERGGAEITMEEWKRKKARDVFKYLVTRHKRSVTVDEIVMHIWGEDVDVERCLPTLQNSISAIRTALEPGLKPRQNSQYLQFRDGSYTLDLSTDSIVDLHVFSAAASAALLIVDPHQRLLALDSAADAYTGDFLPDDVYDDWTDFTRITTRELAIEVLNQLAATQFSLDMESAGRITMQRLAALDP